MPSTLIKFNLTPALWEHHRSKYSRTTYNPLGNLLTKSLNYATSSYTYAGTDFANPHAVTNLGGSTWSYDHAGNLTQAGSVSYTWNAWGRMATSTLATGKTASSSYDHDGARIIYSDSATTSRIFNKLFESTINSYRTKKNIYANGELVLITETLGNSVTPYTVHTDHLGSTNITTSSSGALREQIDYYPYGGVRSDGLNGANYGSPRKYIGEKYDSDTQLAFLNARYMSGTNGKFISQDPVARDIGGMGKMPAYIIAASGMNPAEFDQNTLLASPQLQNSYSYSGNNPINYSDPSGLSPAFWQQLNWANRDSNGYVAQSIKNETAGYQKAGLAVGGGMLVAGGLVVAPTVTVGALAGVADRMVSDAQSGVRSTNGQLFGAGLVGAFTAGVTAEAGLAKTLLYSGVISAGGNYFIDGSVQPVDVASTVIATGVGRGAVSAFSTPQTSQLLNATIGGTAEVATKAAAGAVVTPANKKQQ